MLAISKQEFPLCRGPDDMASSSEPPIDLRVNKVGHRFGCHWSHPTDVPAPPSGALVEYDQWHLGMSSSPVPPAAAPQVKCLSIERSACSRAVLRRRLHAVV